MHFSAFWIYHNYGVVRVTIMITPLRDLLVLNDNGTFVIILTVIMSVVMVNFFIYFHQNDRHSHWYYKTTVNIILVRNHYKVSEVSLSEVIFS